MQKIVPCGWFNHNGVEAAEFYASVFPDTSVVATSHYPTEGLPEFQQEFAGKPLVVELNIAGFRIALINADDAFRPNPALNFMLNFAADQEQQLRDVWEKLTAEGTELMPLGDYPFSPLYSWVEDKYGMSWQLMLAAPEDHSAKPFVVPSFLFGGAAQNKARPAMEKYGELFGEVFGYSGIDTLVPWPENTGPATTDSVLFASFQLAGQAFSAMDSGAETDFTFSPGVSLMVHCETQQEIDRLWDALSAVPEAEMCGWCVDEFGVSWQIVPANFDELFKKPGAYQKMLGMKKLMIAEY